MPFVYILRLHLHPFTKQPTGRAVGLRPTVLSFPCIMSLQKQCFDCFPIRAGTQLAILPTARDVCRGIAVSMCLEAADPAAKRLLVGSVLAVGKVTHMALLRRIGAFDPCCSNPAFRGIPGNL